MRLRSLSILLTSIVMLITTAGCTVTLPVTPAPTVIPSTMPSVPSAEPSPTPELSPTPFEGSFCAYSSGLIEDDSIDSKLLSHPLEVKIYLPPCYNKARQAAITNEILEIVSGAEALKNS